MPRRALLILAVGACLAPALPAQVTVLDEGTFSLSVDGVRVGREDFSIRASRGAAAAFVAQGTVLAGERRTVVATNLDSLGRPLRFQVEMRDGATIVETYLGLRDRGVWSGRALRASGESARESRLPEPSVAVEPGIVHHLWLLMRFGQAGSVTMVMPRTSAQLTVRLENAGADSVGIGGRRWPASRWIVRPAAGGSPLWELWTDEGGRLLRATDTARGLDAIRDEPPRG